MIAVMCNRAGAYAKSYSLQYLFKTTNQETIHLDICTNGEFV